MKKHIQLLVLCAVVVAALLFAATSADLKGLDMVGRGSVSAFGDILEALPEDAKADGSDWALRAPDGAVRFVWSRGVARLEMDAEPFVKAGLVPEKLPDTYTVFTRDGRTMFAVGMNWGEGKEEPAVAAYGRIVDAHRDHINYHSFLDHYGVRVGGGNMFEWAKDMAVNGYDGTVQDKDIVFALNPAPLMAAGVDPGKIDGWVHAEVPVMTGGSVGTEWNLLKPFDLR